MFLFGESRRLWDNLIYHYCLFFNCPLHAGWYNAIPEKSIWWSLSLSLSLSLSYWPFSRLIELYGKKVTYTLKIYLDHYLLYNCNKYRLHRIYKINKIRMNFLFFNTAALKFMQALQLFHLKYAAPFFFFFVYIIWNKINAHALMWLQ